MIQRLASSSKPYVNGFMCNVPTYLAQQSSYLNLGARILVSLDWLTDNCHLQLCHALQQLGLAPLASPFNKPSLLPVAERVHVTLPVVFNHAADGAAVARPAQQRDAAPDERLQICKHEQNPGEYRRNVNGKSPFERSVLVVFGLGVWLLSWI